MYNGNFRSGRGHGLSSKANGFTRERFDPRGNHRENQEGKSHGAWNEKRRRTAYHPYKQFPGNSNEGKGHSGSHYGSSRDRGRVKGSSPYNSRFVHFHIIVVTVVELVRIINVQMDKLNYK